MPFNTYKTVSLVVQEFQVRYTEAAWILGTEIAIGQYFRDELDLVLTEGAIDNCQAIAPRSGGV